MIKFIFLLLAFSLLGSCCIIEKESKINGQFTYVEKVSWWRVKTYKEDENKWPKFSFKTITVIKDSLTTVTYTTKEKYTKKMGGFFLVTNDEQTKKNKKANPKYKPSDFIMEGTFQQRERSSSFRYQNEKIIFKEDGSCERSWTTSCSDSPCGSIHMEKGIYKISSDTVYIVYYLGKSITIYYPIRDSSKVNIEDLKWDVQPLVETNFILKRQHDSLEKITENGKSIRNGIILLPKDSVLFINRNTKLNEIIIEKKPISEEKYINLIRQGDQALSEKKWNEANARYVEAVQTKPGETYAKDRLAELQKIFQDENDQEYQKLKLKADEYFESKNYEKALELYKRAIAIQPSDESVKTKIDKCELEIEKNKK